MDVKEAYRVLGLEMGAPRHEVVVAYRSLMHKWHPDRVASSGNKKIIQEATRMSQVINEAYDYLKNIAPDENSGASKNNPEREHSKPERARQNPHQRSATASSSSYNPGRTQSESRPRNPEASRSESEHTRSQADSASQSQPRPPPVPGKRTPPASFNLKFAPILFGVVTVTVILALIISAQKNPPEDLPTTTQTQQPTNISPENRVIADTQKINERLPQIAVVPKGGILATTNLSGVTIEATKVPANGDARASAVIATKISAYERVLEQLTPGEYTLSARLNGWPEILRTVTVDPGRTTRLAVDFRSGRLRLQSTPSGAVVRFADTILGITPLSVADLPPGECRLSVAYASWPIEYTTVTIIAGSEVSAAIRIPHGRLTIESTPNGADILMNGLNKGQTPLTLEQIPVGIEKIVIQAEDYATSILEIHIEDKSDHKIHPVLSSSLQTLDPNEVLKDTWVANQSMGPQYAFAPNSGLTNSSRPQNGIIRNIKRPILDVNWLRRKFRYSAAIKRYDPTSGLIEFVDQVSEKSKYRVVAHLSPETRDDKDFKNRLLKGAVVEVSGRLSAVEEPRWPLKTVVFQISNARAVR